MSVSIAAALSIIALGLHAGLVRPLLWPAGVGLTVSGDVIAGGLATPDRLRVARPPALENVGTTLVITGLTPNGSAAGRRTCRSATSCNASATPTAAPWNSTPGCPPTPLSCCACGARATGSMLADIVLGQPLFYVGTLGLIALGLRYRDVAQRWLDQRFFREEYDAREILLSLASRVPFENDPRDLVALVLVRVDRALAPESMAVLAAIEGDTLMPVSSLRREAAPLSLQSGLATLLQWSHEPLEVFLDDERSPAARLPDEDRRWLETSGATLLVPIFTSREGGTPALVGVIALGQKRLEEPYTAEDRQLLSAIAAQPT